MELTYQDIISQNDKLNNNNNMNEPKPSVITEGLQETKPFHSYWDKPEQPKIEKKKMTYDDILTSLNLVVSPDGVLKRMASKTSNSVDFSGSTDVDNRRYSQRDEFQPAQFPPTQFPPSQFQPAQFRTKPIQNKAVSFNTNKKIEPELKNSAIYNKYFKGYQDATQDIVPRRPMTQVELRNQLIEDRKMFLYQKKRVSHIKSRQLALTNNHGPIHPRVGVSYENHLFNFSKRK